jgi:hypothetical protein
MHPCIYLYIHPSMHLSIHASIHPSIHLSIYPVDSIQLSEPRPETEPRALDALPHLRGGAGLLLPDGAARPPPLRLPRPVRPARPQALAAAAAADTWGASQCAIVTTTASGLSNIHFYVATG